MRSRLMQWARLGGGGGGACYARVTRELIDTSGRFSGRFKTPLSLGVRTLARREIVDTVCQEKGEDAARSVHERAMKGRTDQDVDELQRIATILNPSFSRYRGHPRNISPSWKPTLLLS